MNAEETVNRIRTYIPHSITPMYATRATGINSSYSLEDRVAHLENTVLRQAEVIEALCATFKRVYDASE